MYRMDAQVDLTLMVPDLLIPNSNLWEASKIRSLFVEENANTILNMTVERHKPAALMWGLTSHGAYSSQSGYKLTETLTSLNSSHHHGLPSVEKMLWKTPPPGMLKCNIGVSWVSGSVNCGVSWITRDTRGKVLMHSRRSYSMVQSREEAELYAILWAVESMQTLRLDNIIFETSFTHARRCLYRWDGQVCAPESYRILNIINSKLQLISVWSLDYVLPASNSIASRIALTYPQKNAVDLVPPITKINSFDTAPATLLASDSRLRPDRYALGQGDLSKAGSEKHSLEERQRAENRTRETKNQKFTPRWFDLTDEITSTPWGRY
ncbi:hypothetical protein DY000_02017939 [Brassica cretica]|uniref:RNase H type-1 domain-containing protein n=1 Tax=Brassica cretica TaxID=69181 RepID=A0ABQ7D391_BRACR|nr:hypothetical protein DY000_02017939 [Brassica cretica]